MSAKPLFAGAASTWNELLAAAEDIIADAQAAADEKIAIAQTATEQSQQARDQSEASNKQLAETLTQTQAERDALQQTCASLVEAQHEHHTALVAEQTRTEGLNALVDELKRIHEQLTADVANADRRAAQAQAQVTTAERAHRGDLTALRADLIAEREAVEQQTERETQRANMLQENVAALEADVAKLSAQYTAACDAHDATRSALQQVEQDLDARRRDCHLRETAIAQRDEQLVAAESARQHTQDHFAVLIAEKEQRVAEQAASMRELSAALKRAQSVQRKVL